MWMGSGITRAFFLTRRTSPAVIRIRVHVAFNSRDSRSLRSDDGYIFRPRHMPDIELPVFPLPIVLFPGISQPLHIFESRYRQLLTDCLEGDRRFGLSLLNPQRSGSDTPRPGDVGCSSVIRSHKSLPDGRSNILIVGERRYLLKRLLERARPYFVGLVEPFADDPPTDPRIGRLATRVRNFFAELVKSVHGPLPEKGETLNLPDDPELLSYHVSAALEVDLATKERLFRLTSTEIRLAQLSDLLKPLIVRAARRASVQRVAKRNGRSHSVPSGPIE